VHAFAAAVRLLTVLPLPIRPSTPEAIAKSPAFFPLVGLGVGGTMALANWLAGLALPALPAAALAVAAGAAVSGAMHLDGLADTFDGLFGGRTPERRLEIMKDAGLGTFGVVAVVAVLIVKWSAIASLGFGSGWAVILVAPAFARLASAWVMATSNYVRPAGLGSPYRSGFGPHLLISLFLSAVVAVVLLGPWALVAVAVSMAVGELTARFAAARLGGGVTGDVYGACVELAEAASLLCLLALLRSGLGVGFPLGG
jgi:adenosylcobinamide-GDP ribazoletransferase